MRKKTLADKNLVDKSLVDKSFADKSFADKNLADKTRYAAVIAAAALSLIFTSCGSGMIGDTNVEELTGDYSEKAINAEWSIEDAEAVITFDSADINVDGEGASVSENTVTITEEGTYVLQGNGENVQMVIDADNNADVNIVLDGVNLSNDGSDDSTAVVYAKEADNLYITLADGTENTVIDKRQGSESTSGSTSDSTSDSEAATDLTSFDGSGNDGSENDLSAAIYSECDVILNGSGSLTVKAGYKDGISTRDDMEIIDGTYVMEAYDDAFVGKDSISVRSGDFTINTTTGDGFKSSNTEDEDKGYIVIDGGNIDITAGDDGIHSEYALVINNGTILIRNCEEGLEAMNIVINDGKLNIFAKDDGVNVSAVNSSTNTSSDENKQKDGNNRPQMGERPDRSSSQKGERPDRSSSQTGERPEGTPPPRPDGETSTDTDDGEENVRGYMPDGTHEGMPGGMPGGNNGMDGESIDGALIINGGSILVTSDGDTLDSNGDMLITGGNIMVVGPTGGGNGSLDYAGSFDITGGTLVIAGSSGMEAPIKATSDDIKIITAQFDTTVSAETQIDITDSNGNEVISFKAAHDITYVSMASSDIDEEKTYTVTADGTSVTAENGAYEDSGMGGHWRNNGSN